MTAKAVSRRTAEQVLRFVFPPACIACGAGLGSMFVSAEEPYGGLCDDCRSILRPLDQGEACPRCGISPVRRGDGKLPAGVCGDCRALPDSFVQARSSFPYQSPAGRIVRNLKYHRAPHLAEWLIGLSVEPLQDWFAGLPGDLLVVAVPMAWRRELKRGYNQAGEIARALSIHRGYSLLSANAFLRPRHTKPQARYGSREERLQNLEAAFFVKRPQSIEGRALLLVDDVMTTGTTMALAAKALREAGAGDVYLFSPVRARFQQDDDWELAR